MDPSCEVSRTAEIRACTELTERKCVFDLIWYRRKWAIKGIHIHFMLQFYVHTEYRPVGGRLSNQETRTCRSSKINPGAGSLLYLRNTICAWNNSNIHIKQRTLGKRICCTAVFFPNYLCEPKRITPKLYSHYIQPRPNFLLCSHSFLLLEWFHQESVIWL